MVRYLLKIFSSYKGENPRGLLEMFPTQFTFEFQSHQIVFFSFQGFPKLKMFPFYRKHSTVCISISISLGLLLFSHCRFLLLCVCVIHHFNLLFFNFNFYVILLYNTVLVLAYIDFSQVNQMSSYFVKLKQHSGVFKNLLSFRS